MPTTQSLSPFQKHVRAWESCTKCPLCNTRKKVVIGKGQLPSDVCFIGEAPGVSENIIGRPFIGPAGILLDEIIATALRDAGRYGQLKLCFTNVVACLPTDGTTPRKKGEPNKKEMDACSPRVIEFIRLAKPKVIVCVGDLAFKQSEERGWSKFAKVFKIYHPSYLIQLPLASKSLEIKRTIVNLTEILESV